LAAYREDGVAAMVHGNRGRSPAHALPAELRDQVLRLARSHYAGCNDQHLTELLAEREGILLARSSLRRILRAAGINSPRSRRAPKYRQRRLRRAQPGMLVQIDGSPHRWLEDRAPGFSLLAAIDDATSQVVAAIFRTQEDSHGYFLLIQHLVTTHGCPVAVYHDRHSIVRPVNTTATLDEQLAGVAPQTQFGRLLTELGISSVVARSPQAKGRVERLFGAFQDRLVSELRLADISSIDDANSFLRDFLPRYNARFMVPANDPASAWRLPAPDLDLQQVFAFTYLRTVAADNTVQFGQHCLQIQPDRQRSSYARTSITVQERLDGSLALVYQGRILLTHPAPLAAPTLRARAGRRAAAAVPAESHVSTPLPELPVTDPEEVPVPIPTARTRPAPDHPWRTPRRNHPVS
jgi:hypothetical protein